MKSWKVLVTGETLAGTDEGDPASSPSNIRAPTIMPENASANLSYIL